MFSSISLYICNATIISALQSGTPYSQFNQNVSYPLQYSQYKEVRSKEKFRKEHSSEISKYESAVRQLKDLFPDNKIPKLETERDKMKALISERNQLNNKYKETKSDIEKMEIAKQSIDEYLSTQDRSGLDL